MHARWTNIYFCFKIIFNPIKLPIFLCFNGGNKIVKAHFHDSSSSLYIFNLCNVHCLLKHCSLVGSVHINFQHSSIYFPSLKRLKLDSRILDLGKNIVDSMAVFLACCPILETLDTYFKRLKLTKVPVPSSSKRLNLKLTGGDFSWTCLQINYDEHDVKLYRTYIGIIGNLQTVEEAYLDVKVNLSTVYSRNSENEVMVFIYFCITRNQR